jgi:hypothetical protein
LTLATVGPLGTPERSPASCTMPGSVCDAGRTIVFHLLEPSLASSTVPSKR